MVTEPGHRSSGVMGNTFDPTGSADFLTQPIGSDGSDWEYDMIDYSIPYTDGKSHLHHGYVNNVKLIMEKGELTYISTFVNMHGGVTKNTGIKYSQADENDKEIVDQALRNLWNSRLHFNEPDLQIKLN